MISYAVVDVIDVLSVKKCLMFSLNYKTVGFFIQKLLANNRDEIPYQPVL